MVGPFGGTLSYAEHTTLESLEPIVAFALAASFDAAHGLPSVSSPEPEHAARKVSYDVDPASGVRYAADLSVLTEVSDSNVTTATALAALVRVARRLEQLHTDGVFHGDLRPDMVWVGADGDTVLIVPSKRSAPGAVLRARLRSGAAAPSTLGFAAPEVVAGFEATSASDVYGLAAIVFARLAGHSPLGQIDLGSAAASPLGKLAPYVAAALAAVPAQRPSLADFVAALDVAAGIAATIPAIGTPYRGAPAQVPVSSAAEAQAVRAKTEQISIGLVLVLLAGAVFAFVGAILLVMAGWDVVGELGRVAMLATLSGAAFGAGALAARNDFSASAAVLRAVGAIFATVAGGYAFALANGGLRMTFLVAIDTGAFVAGYAVERRGAPRGGAALIALGTQLLWATGGWMLYLADSTGAGPLAALAVVITAVTYGLALVRESTGLGVLGALDFAVCAVAFGDYLSTGSIPGPSLYALCVALAYAALAAVAALRRLDSVGMPMAGSAVLAALASAVGGLLVLSDHGETHWSFGVVWPFVVAATLLPFATLRRPFGVLASGAATAILVFAPTLEALIRPSVGFALFPVTVGFALLIAALFSPRSTEPRARSMMLLFGGLGSACTMPALAFLHAADGYGGEAAGISAGTWLAMIAAVSAGLVVVALAAPKGGGFRTRCRIVEFVALGQGFGLSTMHSLAHPSEWVYPVAVCVGATVTLALGAVTRRAMLLLVSAVTLIVTAWIQYFVRLDGIVPMSLRLVGFGVGLLAGGVLYEQQVKRRLPGLREWN